MVETTHTYHSGNPIRWFVYLGTALLAAGLGAVIAQGGLMAGLALLGLPAALFFLGWLMQHPRVGLDGSMLVGFFSAGISRYLNAPWGLAMDSFLFIGWLAFLFLKFRKSDWSPLRNSAMTITLVWFGLVVMELANPESNGLTCWFYAMRGAGFYQLLTFGLTFLMLRDVKDLDRFLRWMIVLSVIGSLWGLRQLIFGVDAAEYRWLYVDGFAFTHILAGKLRVFSFYSDAGQFGASQAMVALICGIVLSAGAVKGAQKWLYITGFVLTFVGFAISGTRGALAVPAVGAIGYLVISRNFKVLSVGLVMIGLAFYILKFTFAFQGVDQIRRMRTAMNPDDPSMLVRLNNQKTFGHYLATRPFGGGIGAAGFWGFRFNPYSLLANTATDSYYVKIWAETGIIGICLHLFMFGFFVGKGGLVVWHLRDPVLRAKIAAIYCGMLGVFMASYGNQVYSQMPTGILMGIGIPLIFISPKWDMEPKI